MLILTIRTDKPEAELGLYADNDKLAYIGWSAHRQLAETIHSRIEELILSQDLQLKELDGIVAYRGPGSFTGLRIGLSVANALADGLIIPIVAEVGDDWIGEGIRRLVSGGDDGLVLPEYGSPPHITQPKR